MSSARKYVSPKREAQAQATRNAILEAFAAQLSEPGRDKLSPSEAAEHAGVSLRTVHFHFPNEVAQAVALGEWYDTHIRLSEVPLATGPDDLPHYYREIHRMGLKHPITRVLSTGGGVWRDMRATRRAARLEAIRRAVKAVGAPARATADATAVLLSLSGADASWSLYDHGLTKERIPDVIAGTVRLLLEDLREKAGR
jgi:AcrR family transcriptional regulator